MKDILVLLILVFHSLTLISQDSEREQKEFEMDKIFQVNYASLTINVKGKLASVIKYKNRYHCFFKRSNPFSTHPFEDFYIISLTGDVEYKIEVPDTLNYSNWSIRNDSVIAYGLRDQMSFYLDTIKQEWTEIPELDDMVFEDEDYSVNHISYGEWGSTVWFRNKKTGKEYELASTAPKVNKLDGVYFLANNHNIFKIKDPTKLKLCDKNNYYKTVKKNKLRHISTSEIGAERIVKDTTSWSGFSSQIVTSFVYNDNLYFLCANKNIPYIAKIDDGTLRQIQYIGKEFFKKKDLFFYPFDPINRNHLLKIQSSNRKHVVFFDINDNEISLIDVINIDSAKYFGTEKANKIFKEITDYHIKNIGNLFLIQIDSTIPNIGGENVTPHHKISVGKDYYPNQHNFELETPRVYKIIEDSTFTLFVNYYYTRQRSSIKIISCNWRETHEMDYDLYSSENENYKINQFQNKLEGIEDYLTDKLGHPLVKENVSNGNRVEWSSKNGVFISLNSCDLKECRRIWLKIYKD